MASRTTQLNVQPRTAEGSRSTRRLRREGFVPGVLYGGDEDPIAFTVEERELRHALAGRGAVLEVNIDGSSSPAVLKDAQIHPVRETTMHVDLLRVNLNVAIQAVVPLELAGGDDAPGTKEGGVLEQITREVNIEALPTDIPESISLDVSGMEINDTLLLSSVVAPNGVTLLDDLEETVVATLTPPRLEVEEDEGIEEETEVVGEGGDAPAAEGDADAGDGGGDDSGSDE